jgi:argininosuccinate lyase
MKKADQIRKERFGGDRGPLIAESLLSASTDRCIAYCDLRVNMAHVLMFAKHNLIDLVVASALLSHLHSYMNEGFPESVFDPVHEGIHAGIAAQLITDCGVDLSWRMHLGRSRNDEVATCLRMQTCLDILEILDGTAALRRVLLDQVEEQIHRIMQGFTHFQHAQSTTLAHHLLVYEAMFASDTGRLFDASVRLNVSPLESAAFAGTGFAIDRRVTKTHLGFSSIMANSMDSVASRDFMLEVLSMFSTMMANVSRLLRNWCSGAVHSFNLWNWTIPIVQLVPSCLRGKILISQKLCEINPTLHLAGLWPVLP